MICNKYIEYKNRYYYLRYINSDKIIYKSISFYDLYIYIKVNKLNKDKILFNCTFNDLCRDFVRFENERI